MEKMIDFDEWIQSYVPAEIEYVAVFDPLTGAVIRVGPSSAFETEKYKIVIDKDIAESILTAELSIHKCVVDINSNTLEIAEVKDLVTMDYILHRIISTEYSNIKKPDIYLTYNKGFKTLKIELSEEFSGTRLLDVSVKKRKVVWDGDTELNFLITDYNDPNIIFEMFSVKVNELINNFKVIENVSYEKFSIYTRRLFKNYIVEYT